MRADAAARITVPLPEVLEFREGPGILARDFRTSGVPLLRLAGLKPGAQLLSGCNYLDPDMVNCRWDHFRVRQGDVLLSTSASLGQVAVVGESAIGAIPYTGIIAFRPRDDRIHESFVRHALTAPSFARQVEAMGAGSVLRHFGPMHLRQMTVDLPPVAEQRAIADVLDGLDETLANNRRLVASIESLIAATWDARFGPSGSSLTGRVMSIGSVVELRGGSTPSTKQPAYWEGGTIPFATPKDLSQLRSVVLLATERSITDEGLRCISSGLLPADTVLLSSRAPIGYIAIAGVPVAINQGFIALCPTHEYPALYLWQWVRSNLDLIKTRANGTTFLEVSKAAFRPVPFAVPTPAAVRSWNADASELYERLKAAELETRSIEELRAFVHPRLLAGELRVTDTNDGVYQ